jgi:Flp pilus assembly protein CpaB
MMARSILLSQTAPATPSGTRLVVAAKPLRFGAPLTGDNVQEIDWVPPSRPKGRSPQ